MIKLELQQTDNVITAINKISSIKDLNVEVTIPEESVLFENILNLKLIQKQADKMEKSIEFVTDDEMGNILLESITGKTPEFTQEEEMPEYYEPKEKKTKKISLPHIPFPKILRIRKGALVIGLTIVTLIGSFIYYGITAPKAKATITVGSQPFTRSITVKVKGDSPSNVGEMVLRGITLSTSIEETLEKDTTGTKLVGEKAEGDITVYNRTSSKIKLEKGDSVTYKGGSEDLKFVLKSDVEVPAREDPLEPEAAMIPGEATVKIMAGDIGEDYNIDKGKTLEFSDYDKDELVAKTKEDISGGKSEEIKIVTEEDRTALSNDLRTISIQKAENTIKSKLAQNQRLIEGSIQTSISSEKFSSEIGDEKEKISLTQTAVAEALVYTDNDLNNFIDEYFKGVIPEGHYMPDKDKEVKVNVLGKSTNSVLSSKEADIQVTLRSVVIPDIKEDAVKESLKGKNDQEARIVIESLKNVEQYEFSISPAVPFFSKVPNDIDRIEVILIKEDKGESL